MKFAKLFREFTNNEKASGFVLLFCSFFSMYVANSQWGADYVHFWHEKLDLSFAVFDLDFTIEHWINDGLMAIFFLLVGLEIERELYVGELSIIKNAVLPIAAALGGMIFPATIYLLVNLQSATQNGYGIPMATDIAFTLSMLSLLGRRIPHPLRIFLTALAIIDDLGAIIVIAIFYSRGISVGYLSAAMGVFVLLLLFNRLKIRLLFLYLFFGLFLWYFIYRSGVHASISGVLLAFAIPFGKHDERNISYHLQHFLHKPVAFFILPIFALANTGIFLGEGWHTKLLSPNSLGIMLGLFVGKPLGITFFCWLMVKLRLGTLPKSVNWKLIIGAGILAGIGFTMSIFITNLAFRDEVLIRFSKISVLTGSLIATLTGLLVLFIFTREPVKKEVMVMQEE